MQCRELSLCGVGQVLGHGTCKVMSVHTYLTLCSKFSGVLKREMNGLVGELFTGLHGIVLIAPSLDTISVGDRVNTLCKERIANNDDIANICTNERIKEPGVFTITEIY